MSKGISREEAELLEDSGSEKEDIQLYQQKTVKKPLQGAQLKGSFVKAKKEDPSLATKTQTVKPKTVSEPLTQHKKESGKLAVSQPTQKKQAKVEPESLSQSSEEAESEEEEPVKTVKNVTVAKTVQPTKPEQKSTFKKTQQEPAKPVQAVKNAKPAPKVAPVVKAPVKPVHKTSSEDVDSSEEEVPVTKKPKTTTVTQPPVVLKKAAPVPVAKTVPLKKEQMIIKSESESEEDPVSASEEVEQEEEQEEEVEQEEEEEEEEEEEPVKAAPVPSKPFQKPAQKQEFENKNQGRFGEFEVHIGNIPFNCSFEEITKHFSNLKDFLSVKVINDAEGRSKGRAFGKFSSEKGQQAALELNGSTLAGRKIFVEMPRSSEERAGAPIRNNFDRTQAEENPSVIVRNLPFKMDEEMLEKTFSGCGSIKSCRIIRNEDGSNRGFGFVDFNDIESAKKAVKKCGEKFGGREINVQFQMPRKERTMGDRGDRGDFRGGRGDFRGGRGDFRGGRGGSNTFANQKKGYIENSQMEVVEFD